MWNDIGIKCILWKKKWIKIYGEASIEVKENIRWMKNPYQKYYARNMYVICKRLIIFHQGEKFTRHQATANYFKYFEIHKT